MSQTLPPLLSATDVIERFDHFCIDAFGVLVDHGGQKPGAIAFIHALVEREKNWLIVTNDAARTPATAAAWYRSLGLPIDANRVLTSSALLEEWVELHSLRGKPVLVLGPDDAKDQMQNWGVDVCDHTEDRAVAIALCDEAGYPFLEAMDAVTSWWMRRLERGLETPAALANPDLIYPRGGGAFGIAAGSVANLLEAAICVRFPSARRLWTRLGKPHAPMFDAAKRRLQLENLSPDVLLRSTLMIGDTLHTDIAGGRAAGLRTALVVDGVQRNLNETPADSWPDYRLDLHPPATSPTV